MRTRGAHMNATFGIWHIRIFGYVINDVAFYLLHFFSPQNSVCECVHRHRLFWGIF